MTALFRIHHIASQPGFQLPAVPDILMPVMNDFVEASAPLYLENLKYLGISLNVENSRNSVQPQEEKIYNKVVLVCRSNICVKQLLSGKTGSLRSREVATLPSKCQLKYYISDLLCWWSGRGMTLHDGRYYFYFFVITYGKVSLWL